MKITFIPIDYDYFDFNGRNIVRVVGRNENGKRVCVVDTCPAFFWAILKPNISDKKVKSLIEKISKISEKILNEGDKEMFDTLKQIKARKMGILLGSTLTFSEIKYYQDIKTKKGGYFFYVEDQHLETLSKSLIDYLVIKK